MCTLQSKYQREAERFLDEATRLITLAVRTNYLHQTRERGVEPRIAKREADDAIERLLTQLRLSAQHETTAAHLAFRRGDPI